MLIRLGEPFMIGDLAQPYAEDPRAATQEVTERISTAIKRLAYHVESLDRIPFVERLVDVYFQRALRTGIMGVRGRGLRGELKQKMAACLNHYAGRDPEAVAEVERELKRYERLRDTAGLDRRLLEEPAYLLPGPLAPVQAAVELLAGSIPALFGFLTGALPYFAVKHFARRASRRERGTLRSCRSATFWPARWRFPWFTVSRSHGCGVSSAASPRSRLRCSWCQRGCLPGAGLTACEKLRRILAAERPLG